MAQDKLQIEASFNFVTPMTLMDADFFKSPGENQYNLHSDFTKHPVQLTAGGDYWQAGVQYVAAAGDTPSMRIGQNYYGVLARGRLPIARWIANDGDPLMNNFALKPHVEVGYGESWKINSDKDGRLDDESLVVKSDVMYGVGLLASARGYFSQRTGFEVDVGATYDSSLDGDVEMVNGFLGLGWFVEL